MRCEFSEVRLSNDDRLHGRSHVDEELQQWPLPDKHCLHRRSVRPELKNGAMTRKNLSIDDLAFLFLFIVLTY
jgi:hypothetical protein